VAKKVNVNHVKQMLGYPSASYLAETMQQ